MRIFRNSEKLHMAGEWSVHVFTCREYMRQKSEKKLKERAKVKTKGHC